MQAGQIDNNYGACIMTKPQKWPHTQYCTVWFLNALTAPASKGQ